MSAFTEARMHLGVELRGAGRHPAALRLGGVDPGALAEPAWWTQLVRDAAARGLDLVVLPEPGGVLDATALAGRIAPFVPGIGLVPQVDVAGVEPGVLAKTVSALDVVSTGWEPVTSTNWRESASVVEGVLEPDDGVRRLAHSRPLTVVRAHEPDALAVAAGHADVVRVAAPGLDAAHAVRERVRDAAARAGRHPDDLTVLLDVEVHLAADARASLRRSTARVSSRRRHCGWSARPWTWRTWWSARWHWARPTASRSCRSPCPPTCTRSPARSCRCWRAAACSAPATPARGCAPGSNPGTVC